MLIGVFAYFSRDMFPSKAVLIAAIFVFCFDSGQAKPRPSSIIRERHVIHTPIKFRVIHHYKIKKIPLIIKKHLHFHKHPEKAKSIVEEVHINHVQHDDSENVSPHFEGDQHDDSKGFTSHYDVHHLKDGNEYPLNVHLQSHDGSNSYINQYKPFKYDSSEHHPPYTQHDDSKEYISHYGKYKNNNNNYNSHVEFHQSGANKGYSSYIQHDDSRGITSPFDVHGDSKGYTSNYEVHHHDASKVYPAHSQTHQNGNTKGYIPYYKPQKHNDSKEHSSHQLHSEYEIPAGVLPQEGEEENQEEDYEDTQQSQEDYDYEYE